MYLIQGMRFGSWKIRRLNWALDKTNLDFKNNDPWVKTALTSLRCNGNSDLDKIHRIQSFGLFLQSWTKVLGQIYICGVFSHVPNEQPGANSSTYVQPLPPLPSTMLDMCTRYFSRGSTLYGGGGGRGKAMHFETENSAFLKLRFKHTEN